MQHQESPISATRVCHDGHEWPKGHERFQYGALNRGPFKDIYILAALSNTCLWKTKKIFASLVDTKMIIYRAETEGPNN